MILFLGDGVGDSEISIARNDAKGAAGELAAIAAGPEYQRTHAQALVLGTRQDGLSTRGRLSSR